MSAPSVGLKRVDPAGSWGGHSRRVSSVSLTPDGRKLLSGSLDRTLKLWQIPEGTCLATLEGHVSDVNAVAITPDGRRGFSRSGEMLSGEHVARVWDLASLRPVRDLAGHTNEVSALCFDPRRGQLLSAGVDAAIRLWDV